MLTNLSHFVGANQVVEPSEAVEAKPTIQASGRWDAAMLEGACLSRWQLLRGGVWALIGGCLFLGFGVAGLVVSLGNWMGLAFPAALMLVGAWILWHIGAVVLGGKIRQLDRMARAGALKVEHVFQFDAQGFCSWVDDGRVESQIERFASLWSAWVSVEVAEGMLWLKPISGEAKQVPLVFFESPQAVDQVIAWFEQAQGNLPLANVGDPVTQVDPEPVFVWGGCVPPKAWARAVMELNKRKPKHTKKVRPNLMPRLCLLAACLVCAVVGVAAAVGGWQGFLWSLILPGVIVFSAMAIGFEHWRVHFWLTRRFKKEQADAAPKVITFGENGVSLSDGLMAMMRPWSSFVQLIPTRVGLCLCDDSGTMLLVPGVWFESQAEYEAACLYAHRHMGVCGGCAFPIQSSLAAQCVECGKAIEPPPIFESHELWGWGFGRPLMPAKW